jgi:modulator of FtsH protease
MERWENFLIAEIAATATLTGLIFIGLSFNLTKILTSGGLPNRALQALIFLITLLIVSLLLLVPDQSMLLVGAEVLIIGIVVCVVTFRLNADAFQKTEPQYQSFIRRNNLLNQLAILPYMLMGIVMVIWGAPGLYVLVPAVIFAYLKATSDSWVLLVEINR